ncbi:MAG: hypothetical protein ACR2HQ_02720 [Ilumatobacteraceae bacterium]
MGDGRVADAIDVGGVVGGNGEPDQLAVGRLDDAPLLAAVGGPNDPSALSTSPNRS